MRTNDGVDASPPTALERIYIWITNISKYVAFVAIVAMMVIMVVEVCMRYLAEQPLGWNISFIENILMPALVFLGLPYGYVVGAHVAAELLYDRLSMRWKRVLDWLGTLILIVCAILLAYAGTQIMITTFIDGDIPPPLSSEFGVPSWTWRTFLPLGAFMLLVLLVIDTVRPWTRKGSSS